MTRSKRWLLAAGTGGGALALLLGIAAYTLQSNWFQQEIKQRTISALERSTGARVEIKFFHFDWRTLTMELRSVALHGSEPPNVAPLLWAQQVRAGFRLSSLLNHGIDLESVEIQQPEIHLIVRPDGSTNLPPGSSALRNLPSVRVHRFQIDDGGLEVNLHRIPLGLRSQDLEAQCRYDAAHAAYKIHFSSKNTSIKNSDSGPVLGSIDGNLRFEKTRLLVERLSLSSGDSNLSTSGTITNFANPSANFRLSARIRAADAAPFLHVADWRSGEVALDGSVHYDPAAGIAVQGHVTGRKLAYRSESVALSDIDLDSDLSGSEDRVQFPHFVVSAPGIKLSGGAELAHFKDLDLNGRVARFDLRRAASTFLHRTIPWNAIANGQIHFSDDLSQLRSDGSLAAKWDLEPSPGGPPVSGHLDFVYRMPARSLTFQQSQLDLPKTHLSFSGAPNAAMQVSVDSTDLDEINAAVSLLRPSATTLPLVIEGNGRAHFDGSVTSLAAETQIAGNIALSNFEFNGKRWDHVRSRIIASQAGADFTSLAAASGPMHVTGNGHLELAGWTPTRTSKMRLNAHFEGVDLAQWTSQLRADDPPSITGIASGSVDLSGPLLNPVGRAQVQVDSLDSSGLRLNQIRVQMILDPNQARLEQGRMQSGSAVASFSGSYSHPADRWRDGRLSVKIDTNGFPLASVPEWRQREPGVNANAEIHAQGTVRIISGQIEPATADGLLKLRNITFNGRPLGTLSINAVTTGNTLKAIIAGDLGERPVTGAASVQLVSGSPMSGKLHFDRLNVSVLRSILYPAQGGAWPFDGTLGGGVTFEGPLLQPGHWRSTLQVDKVELRPKVPGPVGQSNLVFQNAGPIIINTSSGTATLHSFQIKGKDTALTVAGSLRYDPKQALDIHLDGSVNLQILQLLDPSFRSAGQAAIATSVAGTLSNPAIAGTLDIHGGTFFFPNLPNGLSDVNGRISFSRNRATIQSLTAQTGGGTLSLGGFVSFGGRGPLVYHVQANANNVRLRYAGGASVTANADLRLTGTSQSSILSGTATLSRVVFNPNTDIGNLLASVGAAAAAPANTNEFVTGLHLDVAIQSAANLQLSTEVSRDVETEIDIRLRGTPDHPVLLGSISANQGDIKVFGTKYSINRGEISFRNSVRIEPVVDLDLQTETRGITVNITISGTMDRLNVAYRSDPPLQPRDIIALLTVGRAPETSSSVRSVQSSNDVTALQSSAGTVLGQAVSSSPSRLSKLFGITNVKIDPMVQGIVTNTPQARLTVEQQVSRDLTVTYVTNLSQTAEQVFRVEWALNRQYSVVAVRDENGEFGIDIQYKKRF